MEKMLLIVSEWDGEKKQDVIVNRREVTVTKRGRWLLADQRSFDPRTRQATKTSLGGRFKYRLEAIKVETA